MAKEQHTPIWSRRDVLGSLSAAAVGLAMPEVLSGAAPTFLQAP